MPRKLLFENVSCSRCGGSGNYSYCSMYGSTCFKCAGAGATLTKRGHAAQLWMNARKKVPASTVKVGDRLWSESVFGNYKFTVTSVEPNGNGGFDIDGVDDKGERGGMIGFTEVKRVFTNGELAALRVEAKAFEATLTKSGTVAKRKAAKAAPASAVAA